MDLILSEEQTLLQQSAETLVARHAGPQHLRGRRSGGAGLDRDIWRQIADAGWLGILTPEDSGGLGLGMTELALVLEQAGQGLMLEPVAAAAVAAGAIAQGDQGAGGDLLAAMMSGERIVLPALQEDYGAAEPSQAETTATADGAGFRLSGVKSFIPAAAGADGFLVPAQGPQGMILCSVGAGDTGVKLTI
ncbi:MAG: acyl-CoA dehydrogenase family protein, partial [Rhodospirillales bacterium]|nr:acyl-CoA dehydrogenase family protein [Rhodospirillales bacterium]